MGAIPPKLRRKKRKLEDAAKDAICRVVDERGLDPPAAANWLIDRLRAYLASPEGTGSYYRELVNWLNDDGFNEPDEAWKRRESESDQFSFDRARQQLEAEDRAKEQTP